MDDLCMFCLNSCSTYIKLEYCSCKTITHKECFDSYIKNIFNIENNLVKCIICRKIYNIDLSYEKIIEKIIDNESFVNSFFYSIFFMLQNIFFYLDSTFLYNLDEILRAFFIIIFHSFLLLLTFFPYLLIINLNYLVRLMINCNRYKICNKKVYKIYNL